MNNLKSELEGRIVILSPECYKGDEEARKFKCLGGFGCHSFTMGSAVYGEFLSDGEKVRVEGYEIERFAES